MLRRNLVSRAAGPAKNNRYLELTARHVKHLRGRVNDLISSQNRKVKSHEFNDRPQTDHGRANTQSGETEFGDRCIDNALSAKLFEQTARDFVCALILGDFFAHKK